MCVCVSRLYACVGLRIDLHLHTWVSRPERRSLATFIPEEKDDDDDSDTWLYNRSCLTWDTMAL